MIKPAYNYLLVKKLERDTGLSLAADIEDTHQRFEIIETPIPLMDKHQGYLEYGVLVDTHYDIGQIIYVEKHSEANTPIELEQQGLSLVLISRVIAWEEK